MKRTTLWGKCPELQGKTPHTLCRACFLQKRALWLTNTPASSPGEPRRTLSNTWRLATAVSDPDRRLSAVPDPPTAFCSTSPPPYPPSTLHSLCRGLSTCRCRSWAGQGQDSSQSANGGALTSAECLGVVLGAARRKERPKQRRAKPGAVGFSRTCLESLPGPETADFVS
jgi:hypothetical protein